MVKIWMRWCRLCAQEDPNNTHINVFIKNEEGYPLSETIYKCFSVEFNHLSDRPIMICVQCFHLAESIIKLSQKAYRVNEMFTKLFADTNGILDAKEIRNELELNVDSIPSKTHFESISNMPAVGITNPIMVSTNQPEYTNFLNAITIKTEEEIEIFPDNESFDETSSPETSEDPDYTVDKQKKRAPKFTKKLKAQNDNKPHKCPECNKGFKSLQCYRRHMQCEHDITIEQKPFPSVCEECGKVCKTIYALKEHQISHTNERTLKCKSCDKLFKNKAGLKRHEDTHNETVYICVVCGLKLNTRRTLSRHMICHSDQKQHKCDYCGNEFKRAKALKTHLISHAGIKPYACNFCDKAFSNGANCRIHKKRHHPTELAALEAAGKSNTIPIIPKLKDLRAVLAKTATKSDITHPSDCNVSFGKINNKSLIGKAENKQTEKAKKSSCETKVSSKYISTITENIVSQQQSQFFHEIFGSMDSRL